MCFGKFVQVCNTYKYNQKEKRVLLNQRKNILFFYSFLSSFVSKDIAILASEYNVYSHDFYSPAKWQLPFRLISQKCFLLRHIFQADLIICQFAGYSSVLPVLFGKIFGKSSLIIVGGTDAHYFPGIGYGNWQKKYLKSATAFSFRLCTHIAPKHSSLMRFEYHYDSNEPTLQGLYERMPELKTPYTEITNGYDSAQWKCNRPKRKNTFITMSSGWGYPFQINLKGIDLILAAAPHLPDCEFVILGVPDKNIFGEIPPNVKLLPPCKNEELSEVLSEYEFYLQLSMAEGFPNSLCEAMLCECIPIGSNVFSISEIIGNTGYILNFRDVNELIALIQKVTTENKPELGKAARVRVAENYSWSKRANALLKLCKALSD